MPTWLSPATSNVQTSPSPATSSLDPEQTELTDPSPSPATSNFRKQTERPAPSPATSSLDQKQTDLPVPPPSPATAGLFHEPVEPEEYGSFNLSGEVVAVPTYFQAGAQTLVDASVTEIVRLLPAFLAGGIRRRGPYAAVALAFPEISTAHLECQMSMEIISSKVEYLALELFGAQLEIDTGLRYLYLPGGAKVCPGPTFMVRGGRIANMCSLFGKELATELATAKSYQQAVEQGHDHTTSVSMLVSHRAEAGAIILLNLGIRAATFLRDRLFI